MASAPKTETKTEPMLEVVASPPADKPAPAPDAPKMDQLSRVEDKTARIEEKFARSEERMMRVESALEKATIRLEGATQDMNLQGVREDIARMRADLRKKPGVVTLFVVALVAALIGAAVSFALTRFGIPGLLPR
ncbi:MAG: hypothetical protein MUC44_01915 [Beijerinckiaceae bacterium]|jgi:hypothetical protein|nr:hypothetical protein [Beijerinckiaceae bacterium]